MNKEILKRVKTVLKISSYELDKEGFKHIGRTNQYIGTVYQGKLGMRCMLYLLEDNEVNIELLMPFKVIPLPRI